MIKLVVFNIDLIKQINHYSHVFTEFTKAINEDVAFEVYVFSEYSGI
jgi:hypothetical protein